MKSQKILSVVCAGVLSLTLVACGAQQNDATTTQDASTEQAAPASKATKNDFVGEWKLAKAEANGATVIGDFYHMFGSSEGMVITLDEDGKGTLKSGDESVGLTWEFGDDGTATVRLNPEDVEAPRDVVMTYDEADKSIAMDYEMDDFKGTLTFSADGKLASLPDFDLERATDLKSVDEAVGIWSIYALGMDNTVLFGDTAGIDEIVGGSNSVIMEVEKDGTTKVNSGGEEQETKIEIKDGKATLHDNMSDSTASVKMLDGNLVIDATEATGSSKIFMVFKK